MKIGMDGMAYRIGIHGRNVAEGREAVEQVHEFRMAALVVRAQNVTGCGKRERRHI